MGQMLSRCRSSWCSTSYLDDILIIMAREVIRRAFIQVLEVAIRETESKGPFLGVANGSRRDVKRKDPPVAKKPHANRRSADPHGGLEVRIAGRPVFSSCKVPGGGGGRAQRFWSKWLRCNGMAGRSKRLEGDTNMGKRVRKS